jgi:hypothetical protein
MAPPAQSYATHRRVYPLFHLVVQPLLALNVVVELVRLARTPSLERGWALVVAVAIVLASAAARVMALTVQNRVIRMEQQLRLALLLPAAAQPDVDRLSLGQLIALRFASDEEVPGLVRRAAAGELRTPDQLKRAVRHWQPDHLRA